jgi:tRNA pseudouridine32 synthase/23S rRNA pseudouridine746 synthase
LKSKAPAPEAAAASASGAAPGETSVKAPPPDPVFLNDAFVAVDKPAGWLTVPSRWGERDERPCLGRALEAVHGRLWPVHRLDEEVSGLVLFARTADAHRAASRWFESREIKKLYSALSEAPVPALTGFAVGARFDWQCRLLRGKKRAYESPVGKPARTLALVVTVDAGAAGATGPAVRWELAPLTGRSHQLRYELARHGCPILGDALYGSIAPWADGIALRSVRLDFSGLGAEPARFGLPAMLELAALGTK